MPPFAIVAIPAHNEAERIVPCLAALVGQRDALGAPLAPGTFAILVFANNCTDGTASIVAALARDSPVAIAIAEETLLPADATAGGARRRAMDLAAERLASERHGDGLILTTDADSLVASTWMAATWRAFATGVDAVAGYIEADPLEMLRLGGAFMHRSRLEETYQRLIAEIDALCDPRPHDPWPNHRVAAGASLAVTVAAYRAIGGLPALAVGEDAALASALERGGFTIRHALDVVVSTSCRFDGRVPHGAGETMRQRHATLDAPCDADLQAAFPAIRKALTKGRLRRMDLEGVGAGVGSAQDREFSRTLIDEAMVALRDGRFDAFWSDVACDDSRSRATVTLRPSDLPREIRRAEAGLRALRRGVALAHAAETKAGQPGVSRSSR